jgi:glucose-6-phosphate 1-dehydrogenase
VEAAWQFVMPILNHWQKIHVRDLPEYQCGTWGPVEADRVIAPDGRQWRTL